MNCDGVKGHCSSLGDVVDGTYQAAEDCYGKDFQGISYSQYLIC